MEFLKMYLTLANNFSYIPVYTRGQLYKSLVNFNYS